MTHPNTNPHHPFVFTVLQHVSIERLQRAIEALADASLAVTLTRQTEAEIRALVKNGKSSKEYGVTLTETGAFCSCPDALYRGDVRTVWAYTKKQAGVDMELRLHDFRHTAITRWAVLGVPQEAAMKVSGHKNLTMHYRYANLQEAHLQALFSRLPSTAVHTTCTHEVDSQALVSLSS